MKVKIMITGKEMKTVNVDAGASLQDLVERFNSGSFPMAKVQTWYANNSVVGNPSSFALQDGMLIAGTAKYDGGLN